MPTITDAEAGHGTDAGEQVGLPKVTITGLSLTDLDGTPLSGFIDFAASVTVHGPGELFEGSAVGVVTSGVMASITIPATDAVTPGFTYTITQRLLTPDGTGAGSSVTSGVAIPRSLGATVDVSTLV